MLVSFSVARTMLRHFLWLFWHDKMVVLGGGFSLRDFETRVISFRLLGFKVSRLSLHELIDTGLIDFTMAMTMVISFPFVFLKIMDVIMMFTLVWNHMFSIIMSFLVVMFTFLRNLAIFFVIFFQVMFSFFHYTMIFNFI